MHTEQVRELARPKLSYAFVSLVLWTFFMASSAPTPLYMLYQHQLGFTSVTLTVVFSMYAVGMLASLLIIGSLSDFLGRKPVMAAAILLELGAMLIFLQAGSTADLLIARFIQGCATGMAASVLGAYMIDINPIKAPISNSVVPLTGTGAGVVISSLIVDFGPEPLKLIYACIFAGLLLQLLTMSLLEEPIPRRPGALKTLKPSLGVPTSARSMFMAIMPMNTAVWSLNGFFLSLVPSLVRLATSSNLAITGGTIVGLMSFCGAISVVLLRHQPAEFSLRLGAKLLAAGVIGILIGVYSGMTWPFYIATTIAGFGAGASFVSFTRSLLPLASANERASLISAYYVVSQLSLIIPSISIGVLTQFIGLPESTYYYGSIVLTLLAISSFLTAKRKAA